MTITRSFSLSLRVVETIEVEDDDKPSLPPMPVVETTGETVPETVRPLAKVLPLHTKLRKFAGCAIYSSRWHALPDTRRTKSPTTTR